MTQPETPDAFVAVDEPDRRLRSVRVSSVAATADQVCATAVRIAMVPLALSILGNARYGAWLALLAYLAWLGLADFGLTSAVVNELAGLHGVRALAQARTLICTSFYFLLVTGGAVAALTIVAMRVVPIEDLLGLGARHDGDLRDAVAAAVLITVGAYCLQITLVICLSFQRAYVSSITELSSRVVSLVLVGILYATDEHGFLAFALAMLGPVAVSRVCLLAYLLASDEHVTIDPRHFEPRAARALGRTSGLFLLSGASEMLFSQTPTLVLAAVAGASVVPRFAVPYLLFFNVYVLIGMFNGPLWPAIAEAHRVGDTAWIRRAYDQAMVRTRRLSLVFVPMAIVVGPAVNVWTGGEVHVPLAVTIILALHFAQASSNYAQMVVITGLGLVRQRVASVIGLGVIGFALNVVLVPPFGVTGVVVAMAAAMVATQTWYLPHVLHRHAPFLRDAEPSGGHPTSSTAKS